MKLPFTLVCFLGVFLVVQSLEGQYKSVGELPNNVHKLKLPGLVTSVYDGDTLKFYHIPNNVSNPGRIIYRNTLSVRLIGIDTPEMPRGENPGQPMAQEARDKLRDLILRKRIELELYSKDQYNRILGSVSVNNKPVSLTMVELGLAYVYRGRGAQYGDIRQELLRAETEAKRRKVGLWGLSGNQTPGAYKRQHSSDSLGRRNSTSSLGRRNSV